MDIVDLRNMAMLSVNMEDTLKPEFVPIDDYEPFNPYSTDVYVANGLYDAIRPVFNIRMNEFPIVKLCEDPDQGYLVRTGWITECDGAFLLNKTVNTSNIVRQYFQFIHHHPESSIFYYSPSVLNAYKMKLVVKELSEAIDAHSEAACKLNEENAQEYSPQGIMIVAACKNKELKNSRESPAIIHQQAMRIIASALHRSDIHFEIGQAFFTDYSSKHVSSDYCAEEVVSTLLFVSIPAAALSGTASTSFLDSTVPKDARTFCLPCVEHLLEPRNSMFLEPNEQEYFSESKLMNQLAFKELETLYDELKRAMRESEPHGEIQVNVDSPSNIESFRSRQVVARLYPGTIEQVVSVIKIAIRHKTPVYAVSTGNNWGFGSSEPNRSGVLHINLRKLNQIRSLDLCEGYAIVEPGVSQFQLANALNGSQFQLNVTSSCKHCSVLGNMLDRGIGIGGTTVTDLLAIEGVNGLGKLFRAGANSHRGDGYSFDMGKAAGPDIVGIFVQSCMAIITAGYIKLHHRRLFKRLVFCSFDTINLSTIVPICKKSMAAGNFDGVVKVFSATALEGYNSENGIIIEDSLDRVPLLNEKLILMGVSSADELHEIDIHIEHFTRDVSMSNITPLPQISVYTSGNDLPLGFDDLFFNSTPTCVFHQKLALKRVQNDGYDTERCSVRNDADGDAWVIFRSGFPFTAQAIQLAQSLARRAYLQIQDTAIPYDIAQFQCNDVKLVPSVTFNILDTRQVDMVLSIRWPHKHEHASKRAHALLDCLHVLFAECGLYASRIDIEHHDIKYVYGVDAVNESSQAHEYVDMLRRIKRAVDPYNIIAPGHYALDADDVVSNL